MKVVARNRKALHDYEILERHEAGIALVGSEVKSIRAGKINLLDSYASYHDGKLQLHHMHISPFEQANRYNHDPYRKRTLLMHRREIARLGAEVERKHLTLVPLSLYFEKQWVKVELGLCRGRKKYDKRQKISAAESRRKLRGLVKNARRVLVAAVLCTLPAAASVTLRSVSTGIEDTIPTAQLATGIYVSIPHLCRHLGFQWHWDRLSEKLTCTDGAARLVFTQDAHFMVVDSAVFQLALPPRRVGGSLYLSSEIIDESLGMCARLPVSYDPETRTIMIGEQTVDTAALHRTDTVGDGEAAQAKKPSQGQEVKTIVIDPGHGGKDPGAIGPDGTLEKDVVLAIALQLRSLLREAGNLDVFMTRETDVFIPLRDRTKFANDKKADLFLSIHANSIRGNARKRKQVKGFKIYFLSQAKNEEDKLVAMIENSVIELEDDGGGGGTHLQNILIDMANNEYLNESEDMSIMIAESFGEGVTQIGHLHRGVGQAPFWVLNGAFMPSVLVETAFISNPREEKLLTQKAFQKKVARAIFEAVIRFKKKYEAE